MRQPPPVPVDPLAAIGQGHLPVQHQRLQHRFGFVGQRPFIEILAPQWQFWCLDTNQPHLPAIVQQHCIAIDHLDDLGPFSRLQTRQHAVRRRI